MSVKLTESQVLDIYHRAWDKEPQRQIALDYALSTKTISAIKNGKNHSKITGHMEPEVIDLPGEEWLPVTITEDYLVSNKGRVITLAWGKKRLLKPRLKIINGKQTKRVYVSLKVGSSYPHHYISRLSLMAFKPVESPHLYEVNHIDGDPSNNALENLEWVTPEDNKLHYRGKKYSRICT